ncbi:MAG: hypothetical protein QXE76_07595 [Candidatus Bathyarchaeia archaeon]
MPKMWFHKHFLGFWSSAAVVYLGMSKLRISRGIYRRRQQIGRKTSREMEQRTSKIPP